MDGLISRGIQAEAAEGEEVSRAALGVIPREGSTMLEAIVDEGRSGTEKEYPIESRGDLHKN